MEIICCVPPKAGRTSPKLRPADLPSSLNHHYSIALVYSTSPPVLVCGTDPYKTPFIPFPGNLTHRAPPIKSGSHSWLGPTNWWCLPFRPSYRRLRLSDFVSIKVVTLYKE